MIRNIILESIKYLETKARHLKKNCPQLNENTIDEVVNESKCKIIMLTYIEDERKN